MIKIWNFNFGPPATLQTIAIFATISVLPHHYLLRYHLSCNYPTEVFKNVSKYTL